MQVPILYIFFLHISFLRIKIGRDKNDLRNNIYKKYKARYYIKQLRERYKICIKVFFIA